VNADANKLATDSKSCISWRDIQLAEPRVAQETTSEFGGVPISGGRNGEGEAEVIDRCRYRYIDKKTRFPGVSACRALFSQFGGFSAPPRFSSDRARMTGMPPPRPAAPREYLSRE